MNIEDGIGSNDISDSGIGKNTINPTISKVPGELTNSQSLGNVSFKQHKIKFTAFLYHNGVKYDLTPHVLQMKTHLATGEASGRFTLLMTFKKRWDKLVFPMDYVELSFSRYLNDPPIMFRGFVGNVRRTRIADGSGKLHRAYTINGENFGKIWSNYYIQYLVQEIGQQLVGSDIDASTATTQNLFATMLTENYGIGDAIAAGSIKNEVLIKGFIDKMLNPYIKVLQQVNPQIPELIPMIDVLSDYAIVNGSNIQGVVNQTVFDVITQFGNRPWCEYYIDDFSNGPVLFYRDTPFKDESGNLIMNSANPQTGNGAEYWAHPEIDDTEILEEDVGISDNEVYSYFFTYPATAMYAQTDPRAAILGMQALTIEQESDTVNLYNPHVDLDNMYRFGFKPLMLASNSIPLEAEEIDQYALDLSHAMNAWLVKAFVWSHKMQNGTIRLKGNEHLRIGRYVTQLSTQEEYYIESVDHEITLSQVGSLGNDGVYSFETTIGITRGRDISKDK